MSYLLIHIGFTDYNEVCWTIPKKIQGVVIGDRNYLYCKNRKRENDGKNQEIYYTSMYSVTGGGYSRAEYLKKKHYFKSMGEHCYLQPWNYGTEPEMISFGNNVHIATKVTFINHDITAFMFKYMEPDQEFKARKGEIDVADNVFIGANTTIMYGVHIGSNVIIGAGSVITKDIPDNVVAAGVPCKPVGDFKKYKEKLKVQK